LVVPVVKRPVSVLIKPASSGDDATDKAIDDLRRVVEGKRGLLDNARLLRDVDVTTAGFTRVAHGLRRRASGYLVARTTTAPGAVYSLYDDNKNRTDGDRFLYLRTIGANVTVDLVVF
jgi:hypothetical protein